MERKDGKTFIHDANTNQIRIVRKKKTNSTQAEIRKRKKLLDEQYKNVLKMESFIG
jgi:hypothetical protein